MSLGQHDFNNFCNLSRLILKIGDFTPVSANHKKGIFPLKIAFLGESQRPVKRISNQTSSFKLETYEIFFDLTHNWHLCYTIHIENSRLFTHGIIISNSLILTAATKTQRFANIWKATLAPFAPSNYTPDSLHKTLYN